MTARPLAAAATRIAQSLWTIALVVTMGLGLASCESINFGGGDRAKPPTTTTTAPRPTTVTPVDPNVLPPPSSTSNSNQVKVAILLPFSHPTKETRNVAQAMLNAAQMAMFDMGARRLTLIPRDTGTTPEAAAAAATSAMDQGAELILGPLLAADVRAVAPIARQRNIPVVAFSTDRTVAGDGIFLLSFLPEQEINRVISYATSQGRSRFAAMVPASPYGQRAEEAFRAAVAKSGQQVVAVQSYQPDPQALEPAIKAIARQGQTFDALFLPEGGTMLRSLAPILTINKVDSRVIKLLGTGLWDDPAVAKEASLIGGWYALAPQEQRQNFISRYQQLYQIKPPRIASLGYDAVALASTLSSGTSGRRYTRATIGDPNGFAGIDGIFRFMPDGLTERGLAVMEIGPTGLQTVSPAANTFQSQGF